MIKVLIVDDSPTVLEYMQYIINSDDDLDVVGVAKDGKEAMDMAQRMHPDVITMDLHMPVINGYIATKEIMENFPAPIIIMSSHIATDQSEYNFRAMEAGAVAVVEKPYGPGSPEDDPKIAKMIQTIKLMSEIKVVKRLSKYKKTTNAHSLLSPSRTEIVAIGVSTGGPPVIKTIISELSKDFPYPILIVQHITSGFLQGMVEWLSKNAPLPIHIANQGDKIKGGHVYFAPDDFHMGIVKKGEIMLSKSEHEYGMRPSVSYLFRTITKTYGRDAIGMLLTGMGKDGAMELKAMRDSGSITIAQNKESSIVHGMPGEAIKLGGVEHILSPLEIVEFLNYIANNNPLDTDEGIEHKS
ncbi:MAG: chemotaxis-specific protein-glutamate methyltransferase CheB [bacterium]